MKTIIDHINEAKNNSELIVEAYASSILRRLFAKNPEFQKKFQNSLLADKSLAISGSHKFYGSERHFRGGDLTITSQVPNIKMGLDRISDDLIAVNDPKTALKFKSNTDEGQCIQIWVDANEEVKFVTYGTQLVDEYFRFSKKNMYDKSGFVYYKYRDTDTKFDANKVLGDVNAAKEVQDSTIKDYAISNIDKVYKIKINDMRYAQDLATSRADAIKVDASRAEQAKKDTKAKMEILQLRNRCKSALADMKAGRQLSFSGRRGFGAYPILPCGRVNVKSGENKYFSIFDEHQIDGVMYVVDCYDSGLKYILSHGIIYTPSENFDGVHEQNRRGLFSGKIVDILPVPDFAVKYKSGPMYVFK